MAKGGRGGRRGENGGVTLKTSVTGQNGEAIDLSSIPLRYGKHDPNVSKEIRNALQTQENKRKDAKIEFGLIIDADGDIIGSERKGGKNGINMPSIDLDVPNNTFTHNHPRRANEKGLLGGTFSDADLNTFAFCGSKTFRASAAEGTYSISKTKDFNARAFNDFQHNLNKQHWAKFKEARKQIQSDFAKKKITEKEAYARDNSNFNTFLVEMHNGLLAGQKKYGYYYTLEG